MHDDVIKWEHFPRYWPFLRGIHRSPVNSPHKGLWREASMFSLISAWINRWVNNRDAGDLRRYHAHYDVIVTVRNIMLYSTALSRQLAVFTSFDQYYFWNNFMIWLSWWTNESITSLHAACIYLKCDSEYGRRNCSDNWFISLKYLIYWSNLKLWANIFARQKAMDHRLKTPGA